MSYRTTAATRAVLLAGVAAVSTPAIAQDQLAPDAAATAEATTAPNDDSDDNASIVNAEVVTRTAENTVIAGNRNRLAFRNVRLPANII